MANISKENKFNISRHRTEHQKYDNLEANKKNGLIKQWCGGWRVGRGGVSAIYSIRIES